MKYEPTLKSINWSNYKFHVRKKNFFKKVWKLSLAGWTSVQARIRFQFFSTHGDSEKVSSAEDNSACFLSTTTGCCFDSESNDSFREEATDYLLNKPFDVTWYSIKCLLEFYGLWYIMQTSKVRHFCQNNVPIELTRILLTDEIGFLRNSKFIFILSGRIPEKCHNC